PGFLRHLWIERLEDRTLPSTFNWTGGGADSNWSTGANWNLLSGSGSFPNAVGDVAQFTGTPARTTVTLNQNITVREPDFGTASNITSNGLGANLLTLDNTGNGPNAVINVGALSFTNTGTDVIAAPLVVVAPVGSPLAATVAGGTLQLTNTSTGATANVIGSS